MGIESFHRREKLLALKEKPLVAEEQRIRGEQILSFGEVRQKLQDKINEFHRLY